MTNIVHVLIYFCLIMLSCNSVTAFASFDFLGAQMELKSVPTSLWRIGVKGNKLIVIIVNEKSQANQIGFQLGDVILSIDGTDVYSYKNILEMSPGSHVIKVARRNTLLELPVLIANPEKVRNETIIKSEHKLPPVKVDDELLEMKYGKSESNTKSKKITYQDCIDNVMANPNTYEYYLNNPNSGYSVTGNSRYGNGRSLDYDRAKKKCEQEYQNIIHVIGH